MFVMFVMFVMSPCCRVSLICSCGMYLALFPFDEQTCNLDVASCKFVMIMIMTCNLTVRGEL